MSNPNYSALLAAAQFDALKPYVDKHPKLAIVFALLSLVLGALRGLQPLLERVGLQAAYQKRKLILEILKTKYEIEAIRKREQLDLPPMPVGAEELEAVRVPFPHAHKARWFEPERLRKTYTYRNVVRHPKGGKVLANIGGAAAGFYGFGILVDSISVLSPDVRNELGMWGAAGLSVLCVLMGTALFLWSVRIFRTKKLATAELQGQSLDKPQEIRDQQSVDKTETTLPHRAA